MSKLNKYFEKEFPIFYTIQSFDPRIEFAVNDGLLDDIMQEIRIAFIENHHNEDFKVIFNAANRNIDRMLHLYGWSRKETSREIKMRSGGSGNRSQSIMRHYEHEQGIRYEDACYNKYLLLLKQILDYYETHTCKETCKRFKIKYNKQIQKLFHLCAPKQMGKGGKRMNSGNKPGYNGKEKKRCLV